MTGSIARVLPNAGDGGSRRQRYMSDKQASFAKNTIQNRRTSGIDVLPDATPGLEYFDCRRKPVARMSSTLECGFRNGPAWLVESCGGQCRPHRPAFDRIVRIAGWGDSIRQSLPRAFLPPTRRLRMSGQAAGDHPMR
jgi:hypothetical protein